MYVNKQAYSSRLRNLSSFAPSVKIWHAQLLDEKGANIDATFLKLAVMQRNECIVQILLATDAAVDARDEYEETPLVTAAQLGL